MSVSSPLSPSVKFYKSSRGFTQPPLATAPAATDIDLQPWEMLSPELIGALYQLRSHAQRRWLFVRQHLKQITELQDKESLSSLRNIKNDDGKGRIVTVAEGVPKDNKAVEPEAAIRLRHGRYIQIILFFLLLVGAIVITAYQWGDLYKSSRGSIYSLSDKLFGLYQESFAFRISDLLLESRVAVNQNLMLFNLGINDWTNFVSPSFDFNLQTLYDQVKFFGKYNIQKKLTLKIGISIVTEDVTDCAGGRVWKMGYYSTTDTVTARVIDKTRTQCILQEYSMTAGTEPKPTPFPVPGAYTAQKQPWYVAAKKSPKGGWLPPYINLPTKSIMLTSYAAFNTTATPSTRAGVVAVDVDTTIITSYLQSIKTMAALEPGAVFLTTIDGTLIASSEKEPLFPDKAPFTLIAATASTSPLIRTTANSIYSKFKKVIPEKFEDLRNSDLLYTITRVKDDPSGLDLRLVIAIPTKNFQYFSKINLNLSLIVGFCIIFALVTAIVYLFVISDKLRARAAMKKQQQNLVEKKKQEKEKQGKQEKQEKKNSDGPDLIEAAKNGSGNVGAKEDKDVDNDSPSVDFLRMSRMNFLVLYILLAIITINIILWLIWVSTTRVEAVNDARTLFIMQSDFTTYQLTTTALLSSTVAFQLNDINERSNYTLFHDIKLIQGMTEPVNTPGAPFPLSTIQKLLCQQLVIYNTNYVKVVLRSAAILGCVWTDSVARKSPGPASTLSSTSKFYGIQRNDESNLLFFPLGPSFNRGGAVIKDDQLYDGRARGWYSSVKKWYELYSFKSWKVINGPSLGMTFALPLIDSTKQMIGVIGMDLDPYTLQISLKQDKYIDSMRRYLINRSLKLVSSSFSNNGTIVPAVNSVVVNVPLNLFNKSLPPLDMSKTPIAITAAVTDGLSDASKIDTFNCRLLQDANYSNVFAVANQTDRESFWLLFCEFVSVSLVSTILLTRIDIDLKFTDRDKIPKVSVCNRLGKQGSATKIYSRLNAQRMLYFQDDIKEENVDVPRSQQLKVEHHQSWLYYMELAEKNYNVEDIWTMKQLYGVSSLPLRCLMIELSFWYRFYIGVVIIALCLVAIGEPVNWAITYSPSKVNTVYMGFEALFIILIIFDFFLQTYIAFRVKRFSVAHCVIQFLFSACFIFDWIGYAAVGFVRWSRLLRPLYLVYRIGSVRNAGLMIAKSMFDARFIILLYYFFMTMSAVFAMALVGDVFANVDGDFFNVSYIAFYPAFVNMFKLLSTISGNYSDSVDITIKNSAAYMIFWVTVTIIGPFFILSAVVGQFSKNYAAHVEVRKKRLRARRWMALSAAFIIFDSRNKGTLSRREFTIVLCTYLRTKHSKFDQEVRREEDKQLFKEQNPDASGNCEWSRATLLGVDCVPPNMLDIIFGVFHVVDANHDGTMTIDEFEKGLDLAIVSYSLSNIKQSNNKIAHLKKQVWYYAMFHVLMPLIVVLYNLTLVAYGSFIVKNEQVLDITLTCLLGVMALDIYIRMYFIFDGVSNFLSFDDVDIKFMNWVDFLSTVASIIAAFILWVIAIVNRSYSPFTGTYSLYRAFICLAGLRIFTIHPQVRKILVVLLELVPACFLIAVISVVIFYEYASLGGVFFSGYSYSAAENFNSFLDCCIVVYQLWLGPSTWAVLLTTSIKMTSTSAIWFYVTWIFIVNFLITRLLFGLVIGQFAQYIRDDGKRLILPRIRSVLSGGEITELRSRVDAVLKWIAAHPTKVRQSKSMAHVQSSKQLLSTSQNPNPISITMNPITVTSKPLEDIDHVVDDVQFEDVAVNMNILYDRDRAKQRWLLVKQNLKQIKVADAELKKREREEYFKLPVYKRQPIIFGLRVVLLSLLFCLAFGITAYQWAGWYNDNVQNTYVSSTDLLQISQSRINTGITLALNQVSLVTLLNVNYFNTGSIQWSKFDDVNLNSNLDVLKRQSEYFTLKFSSVYPRPYAGVGLDDSDCPGGQFVGVTPYNGVTMNIVRFKMTPSSTLPTSNPSIKSCNLNRFAVPQPDSKGWDISLYDGTVSPADPPQSQPWYKLCKQSKQPGWTPLYVIDSNGVGITTYRPLINSAFVGVAKADVYLKDISALLKTYQIGTSTMGVIYLIALDGTLVASNVDAVSTNALIMATESENPIIKQTATIIQLKYGFGSKIPESFQGLSDSDLLYTVSQVKDDIGLDLRLIIAIPTSEFQKTNMSMLKLTFSFGLSFILIMLVIILYLVMMSHGLSQKLKRKRVSISSDEFVVVKFNVKDAFGLIKIHDNVKRLRQIVFCLLVTIIFINFALWLIWMAYSRSNAVALTTSTLTAHTDLTLDNIQSSMRVAWMPVERFSNLYKSTVGRNFIIPPLSKPQEVVASPVIRVLCSLAQSYPNGNLSINLGLKAPYGFNGSPYSYIGCGIDIDDPTKMRLDVANSNRTVISTTLTKNTYTLVNNEWKTRVQDYDVITRSWYQAAIDNGVGGWTDAYALNSAVATDGSTADYGIDYTEPLYEIDLKTLNPTNNIIGVISVRYRLQTLSNVLKIESVISLSSMTKFVLDDQFKVMDQSAASFVFQTIPAIKSLSADADFSKFFKINSKLVKIPDVKKMLISVLQQPLTVYSLASDGLLSSSLVGRWMYISSTSYYPLFTYYDSFVVKSFWILFMEFVCLTAVATIIMRRLFIDDEEISASKIAKTQIKKLSHMETIKSVHKYITEKSFRFFQVDKQNVDVELPRSQQLNVNHHQSWLIYLELAEQEYNVEGIWTLQRNYGDKSLPLRLFMIESNFWYRCYIAVVTIALCAVAFAEPANWAITYSPSETNKIVLGFEALFIILIAFDVVLQTYIAFRLKQFSVAHCVIQFLFSACFIFDWIGYAAVGFVRWSRLLRPLYLVYRITSIRQTAFVIAKSMIDAKDNILLLFFFIFSCSSFSLCFFNHITAFNTTASFSGTNFNVFYSAFVQFFILSTSNSNYSTSVNPSIVVSSWYMLFWIPITIAGAFFILSALVGEFVNSFAKHKEANKKRLRARRWLALSAAFIIFDSRNKGTLSRREFTIVLCTYLRTKHRKFDQEVRREEDKQLFKEQNPDASGNCEWSRAALLGVDCVPPNMLDILFGVFHVVDANHDGTMTIDEFEKGLDLAVLSYTLATKTNVSEKFSKNTIWYFVLYRFVCPLVLMAYVLILGAYRTIMIGNETFLDVLLTALIGFMVFDIVIRIVVIYGSFIEYVKEEDHDVCIVNISDILFVLIPSVAACFCWFVAIADKTYQPFSGPRSSYRVFMCFAGLRIFTIHPQIRKISIVLLELVPACLFVLIIVIVLFYEYSSLGCVFFSGITFKDIVGNFNSFLNSWIVMYRNFLGAKNLMYLLISATSTAAIWFDTTWAFFMRVLLQKLVFGIVVGQFALYLSDDTRRLILPRIRNVLIESDLAELRARTVEVLKWIKAHKGKSKAPPKLFRSRSYSTLPKSSLSKQMKLASLPSRVRTVSGTRSGTVSPSWEDSAIEMQVYQNPINEYPSIPNDANEENVLENHIVNTYLSPICNSSRNLENESPSMSHLSSSPSSLTRPNVDRYFMYRPSPSSSTLRPSVGRYSQYGTR